MKKRLLSLVLTLTLVLTLIPEIFAYDPATMTDISGHWGEEYIAWSMEQNLFKGTSDSTFDPNGSMTRGMFVTVLGRFAGIVEEQYKDWYISNLYTDVDENAYYAPYVNWATRYGITRGMGDGQFMPNKPVTREQIATFLVRFASIYNYNLTVVSDLIVDSFTDTDSISEYAVSSVDSMRITGLITGRMNEDGTYYFDPVANATRAEAATVFYRLASSIQPDTDRILIDPTEITVAPETVTLVPNETTSLVYSLYPQDATNQTITWVSSDPNVATVNADGKVTAKSVGTAEIYAYTWNGLFASCTVICERPVSLAYAGETYAEKCTRVFGEVVSDPRIYYQSKAEAEAHMVEISVKVWDFTDSTHTTKTTKTKWLTVHENIADTIIAIFDEIYQCEAQYPICSVGGYRWSPSYKSEHSPGLAIDINYMQNYYCYPDGTAITGTHFDPENDPYSIPVDGEIQQIFEKYGFTRGIYWYSGYKDYMHFSYFGT